MCICDQICGLASKFNEVEAKKLTASLNKHLEAIRTLFTKSKSLARDVRYDVREKNQRSSKIISLRTLHTDQQEQVLRKFQTRPHEFWQKTDDVTRLELGRRLSCVVIYLRHRLFKETQIPVGISFFVSGAKIKELQYAGKKFISIARHLGGIGIILCLPLEIASSTYERYISCSDAEVMYHLESLGVSNKTQQFNGFVTDLLKHQLQDGPLSSSHLDLSLEFGDLLSSSDQIGLLLRALGGVQIPEFLITSVQNYQNRWNEDGQLQEIGAIQAGIPPELCLLLSDNQSRAQALSSSGAIRLGSTDNDFISWSASQWYRTNALRPETEKKWAETALKLVCFSCPPTFESTNRWPAKRKAVIWSLLRDLITARTVPLDLRDQVIEATLSFAEDGKLDTRRTVIELAETLLCKRTAGYLRASVTLFRSIVDRLDGNLSKSDRNISQYLKSSPPLVSRRDHALAGRLHLSQLENMIQRQDKVIATILYSWEPRYPSSVLEKDVSHRIFFCAAKFFQSIGQFQTARESLKECLSLDCTKKRPLIISRLADVFCELREYESVNVIGPELRDMERLGKRGRSWRRLKLASVECALGKGMFKVARGWLDELTRTGSAIEDINDELLHMRTLMANARISHYEHRYDEALQRWRIALQDIRQLSSFKRGQGFTTAIIHLSIAHAQVHMGDRWGGEQSWQAALGILKTERVDYWIPVVATMWLSKIANDLRLLEGWLVSVIGVDGQVCDVSRH